MPYHATWMCKCYLDFICLSVNAFRHKVFHVAVLLVPQYTDLFVHAIILFAVFGLYYVRKFTNCLHVWTLPNAVASIYELYPMMCSKGGFACIFQNTTMQLLNIYDPLVWSISIICHLCQHVWCLNLFPWLLGGVSSLVLDLSFSMQLVIAKTYHTTEI